MQLAMWEESAVLFFYLLDQRMFTHAFRLATKLLFQMVLQALNRRVGQLDSNDENQESSSRPMESMGITTLVFGSST